MYERFANINTQAGGEAVYKAQSHGGRNLGFGFESFWSYSQNMHLVLMYFGSFWSFYHKNVFSSRTFKSSSF